MRISDWSSDVCSSDLPVWHHVVDEVLGNDAGVTGLRLKSVQDESTREIDVHGFFVAIGPTPNTGLFEGQLAMYTGYLEIRSGLGGGAPETSVKGVFAAGDVRSEEHTSELQSLMRKPFAAFCMNKKFNKHQS